MKKTILLIAVVFMAVGSVFVSCDSGDNKFAGFEQTKDGLYYKFHIRGNDTVTPKIGDYVTIDMIYSAEDSVMFDSKELPQVMKMPMIEPTFVGDVYDGMAMMKIGDSATFICNADSVFTKLFRMPAVPKELDSVEYLYFHIKLNAIETLEEVKAAQEIELKELKDNEAKARYEFLEENFPEAQPVASGLYYIETKEGKGSTPEKGQTVSVNYKGMFLDGTVFDSSFDRNEPIEFVLGEGQVIKGWDEGIGMMRKGGKATLVIPSDIAYGPQGRSSIPPYSSLVFEVELLDIK
jgi:FKBP-type peptidyl-prolyl cis-trans isomerase